MPLLPFRLWWVLFFHLSHQQVLCCCLLFAQQYLKSRINMHIKDKIHHSNKSTWPNQTIAPSDIWIFQTGVKLHNWDGISTWALAWLSTPHKIPSCTSTNTELQRKRSLPTLPSSLGFSCFWDLGVNFQCQHLEDFATFLSAAIRLDWNALDNLYSSTISLLTCMLKHSCTAKGTNHVVTHRNNQKQCSS